MLEVLEVLEHDRPGDGSWDRGRGVDDGAVKTLDRDGLVGRLLAGHYLEEMGKGSVEVVLLEEYVPLDIFREFVQRRFIVEVRPGWWRISTGGRNKLRVNPEKSG